MPQRSLRTSFQEGFLIVVSILVAFSLDAGWDRYQEGRVERQILRDLHAEFEIAQGRIEVSIAELQRGVGSTAALLESLGPSTVEISRDSAEALLLGIISGNTLEVPTSVIGSVSATGTLGLIQEEQLRAALAEWPTLVEDVRENHEWHREATDAVFVPYVSNSIAIRNILVGDFVESRSRFELDPVPLQRDPVFEGILAWRKVRQTSTLRESEVLLRAAENVLRLLQSELGADYF